VRQATFGPGTPAGCAELLLSLRDVIAVVFGAPCRACAVLKCCVSICHLQTWDTASRAAWDNWMNARSYAGENWKDAQKAAEHYWRETKGAVHHFGVSTLLAAVELHAQHGMGNT
jgi:hypothetical protein